jgi:hypothetical protein
VANVVTKNDVQERAEAGGIHWSRSVSLRGEQRSC